MKLKTLKDMSDFHFDGVEKAFQGKEPTEHFVSKEALKEEAIKHIKDMHSQIKYGLLNYEGYPVLNPNTIRRYSHQIEWIKWFFDITEKDWR